jgi:hypothetical protein
VSLFRSCCALAVKKLATVQAPLSLSSEFFAFWASKAPIMFWRRIVTKFCKKMHKNTRAVRSCGLRWACGWCELSIHRGKCFCSLGQRLKGRSTLKPPWWSLRSGVVQLPPSFPLSCIVQVRCCPRDRLHFAPACVAALAQTQTSLLVYLNESCLSLCSDVTAAFPLAPVASQLLILNKILKPLIR